MCGPPMPAWLWRKPKKEQVRGEGGHNQSNKLECRAATKQQTPFPENAYTVLQRKEPPEIPGPCFRNLAYNQVPGQSAPSSHLKWYHTQK